MRLYAVLLTLTASLAQIRFEDATARSGLHFELRNGAAGRFHQVELMIGGVAAIDYDNDGCMDVFFANGASLPSLRKTSPAYWNRLFRNACDGTFADVTTAAGLAGTGYSMGAAAADYDNDGLTDLFVAGVNQNALYRNLGNGRFEDVTLRARAGGSVWSVAAGWLDYDDDGDLDLFIVNYVAWNALTEPRCGPPTNRLYCHPDNYRGLANRLLRNNGDGAFTDVTAEAGIGAHIGKGMSAAFADYDNDGFPDIYVTNDSLRAFLFRNRGDGRFEETGIETGTALRADGAPIAGMGADFRDLDGDSRPDLIVSGMVNDTFLVFRNEGAAFADWTERSGVARATRQLTGWGLGAVDFDRDGHRDLFLAVSHFPNLRRYLGQPSEQAIRILRNQGGATFDDVSASAGTAQAAQWRGAAFADFDRDGRVDVVVTALNAPARFLRNVSASLLDGLVVEAPVGSRVRLTGPEGSTSSQLITTAVGYASSSEPALRFAVVQQQTVQVEVRLPGGRMVSRTSSPGNRLIRIQAR